MQSVDNELNVEAPEISRKDKRIMRSNDARAKRKAKKKIVEAKQVRAKKEHYHHSGVVHKKTLRALTANTSTHE